MPGEDSAQQIAYHFPSLPIHRLAPVDHQFTGKGHLLVGAGVDGMRGVGACAALVLHGTPQNTYPCKLARMPGRMDQDSGSNRSHIARVDHAKRSMDANAGKDASGCNNRQHKRKAVNEVVQTPFTDLEMR